METKQHGSSLCKILHRDGLDTVEICTDESGAIFMARRLAGRVTDRIDLGTMNGQDIEQAKEYLDIIRDAILYGITTGD